MNQKPPKYIFFCVKKNGAMQMRNGLIIKSLAAGVAASALLSGPAVDSALAQVTHRAASLSGGQPSFYYHLPSTVRVRFGTARILKRRCDGSYPMDEWMRCGTATGGPVGGRGS